jgi:hypothetical protein
MVGGISGPRHSSDRKMDIAVWHGRLLAIYPTSLGKNWKVVLSYSKGASIWQPLRRQESVIFYLIECH